MDQEDSMIISITNESCFIIASSIPCRKHSKIEKIDENYSNYMNKNYEYNEVQFEQFKIFRETEVKVRSAPQLSY